MKLPKQLVIGDSIWSVKTVSHIDYNKKTGMDTLGYCDPSTHELLIKSGQSKFERLSTLIHEVLHGFEYEYDMRLDHKLIYRLEGKIARFLMDNFLGD